MSFFSGNTIRFGWNVSKIKKHFIIQVIIQIRILINLNQQNPIMLSDIPANFGLTSCSKIKESEL